MDFKIIFKSVNSYGSSSSSPSCVIKILLKLKRKEGMGGVEGGGGEE